MKYIIRKVPERDTSYLERLIPGAEIYSDVNHEGAIKSFAAALRMADDNAVYVQDDMILCRNFTKNVETVISEHPVDVISFADAGSRNSVIRKAGYYRPEISCWLLCTYIPKRIADLYLHSLDTGEWVVSKRMLNGDFDDINFRHWLEHAGLDIYMQVPNLAGHPVNKSSIKKSSPARICWVFDYENCEPGANDLERTLKYWRAHRQF